MDLNPLKVVLAPVAKKYSINLLILHGSQALEKTHPSSDLDLAILSSQDMDMNALTLDFMKVLGREDVDVSNLKTAGPTLLFSIAKSGIVLIQSRPGLFFDFCSLAARKYYDAEKFRRARRELLNEYAKGSTK